MPTYVLSDLRHIQGYVFGSPRLFEMRGASALIDFFDRAAVQEIVWKHGGELIFSGGGNFLAVFENGGDDGQEAARRLEEHARNVFFELTGSDGIEIVRHTDRDGFEQVQRALRRTMAAAKRRPDDLLPPASLPFLKRCESCGRETADEAFRIPGAEKGDPRRQWLGPVCSRKRRMHARLQRAAKSGGRPRYPILDIDGSPEVPTVTEELLGASLPTDFQDLTGGADLALVAADGNGLGGCFDGLSREDYESFSRRVDEALRSALDAAVEEVFPDRKDLPVQILICGGDDLVVALPAPRALDFATRLMKDFQMRDPHESAELRGLAVGLVFAKPSFPFRQAHELAVELQYRAKARCRQDGLCTALDLHRITATEVPSLHHELAKITRGGETESWSYGAAGPYTLLELEELKDLSTKLRKISPSQRGRLREILSPRDDGPQTPLHATWKVPERVVRELEVWLGRQEEPPFGLPEGPPPPELLREEKLETPQRKTHFQRSFKLADALLLAEMLNEPAADTASASSTPPATEED